MKLHATVIDKLLRTYDLYGGRKDNSKLIEALKQLDLSAYQQKHNPSRSSFLVLTEDLKEKPR